MSKRAPFAHKLLKHLDRIDRESIEKCVRDLAGENSVYEEIFQSLDEGVILLDAEGAVRSMNRQAGAWLGLDPEAAAGKVLSTALLESEFAGFLRENFPGAKGRVTADIPLLAPREMQLRVILAPLENLEEKRVLILLADMTSRRESAANDERLARIESLVSLTAGIAHEIGNPLNSIAVHLELLKKEVRLLPQPKRGAFEKTLDVLQSETSRLDKIVRNFLRVTRKPPLRFKSENPNAIVEEALEFMGPELQAQKIRIQFRPDRTLPDFLADRERLYQAFINLIKNAMEAMAGGGSLGIHISHRGKIVFLRFRDEGSGIAEEDLPHIFDAYYTTKEGGSGLGLMTVFNAVREHGGRIEVNSRRGKGTTFTLLLPLRQPKLQLPYKTKT